MGSDRTGEDVLVCDVEQPLMEDKLTVRDILRQMRVEFVEIQGQLREGSMTASQASGKVKLLAKAVPMLIMDSAPEAVTSRVKSIRLSTTSSRSANSATEEGGSNVAAVAQGVAASAGHCLRKLQNHKQALTSLGATSQLVGEHQQQQEGKMSIALARVLPTIGTMWKLLQMMHELHLGDTPDALEPLIQQCGPSEEQIAQSAEVGQQEAEDSAADNFLFGGADVKRKWEIARTDSQHMRKLMDELDELPEAAIELRFMKRRQILKYKDLGVDPVQATLWGFRTKLFVFTVAPMTLDLVTDVGTVRTYFVERYYGFFTIGVALLLAPTFACWLSKFVEAQATPAKTRWSLFLHIVQSHTLGAIYQSFKEGANIWDLVMVKLFEACLENSGQALLSTYRLLAGFEPTQKELFGLNGLQVFELTLLISCALSAWFLTQTDLVKTMSGAEVELKSPMVKVMRFLFRFAEVSLRILSVAYFGAMMRPQGPHHQHSAALWILLFLDFALHFFRCLQVTDKNWRRAIVYASISVYCAPPHFVRRCRSLLRPYYMWRLLELLVMAAAVLSLAPRDHITHVIEREPLLLNMLSASFALFLGLGFLDLTLRYFTDGVGVNSWLIIPDEKRTAEDSARETFSKPSQTADTLCNHGPSQTGLDDVDVVADLDDIAS